MKCKKQIFNLYLSEQFTKNYQSSKSSLSNETVSVFEGGSSANAASDQVMIPATQGDLVSRPCIYFCMIGYHCVNGVCVPIEQRPCIYLCIVGYHCVNGVCVPIDTCPEVSCQQGFICQKGTCVADPKQPDVVVCPMNSIKPQTCTNRPTQKECPIRDYIRQPDPVACGIRADGTRVDFSEDCSACKDTSIVYYFKIPFICSKDEQCLGYYCGNSRCNRNCDCPYNWQTCRNGKCIDPCRFRKCHDCKYGKCGYIQPNGSCFLNDDSKCMYGWKCVVSQCGDLCWNKPCPPNQNCNEENGSCS